jgi:hypothetical protein
MSKAMYPVKTLKKMANYSQRERKYKYCDICANLNEDAIVPATGNNKCGEWGFTPKPFVGCCNDFAFSRIREGSLNPNYPKDGNIFKL